MSLRTAGHLCAMANSASSASAASSRTGGQKPFGAEGLCSEYGPRPKPAAKQTKKRPPMKKQSVDMSRYANYFEERCPGDRRYYNSQSARMWIRKQWHHWKTENNIPRTSLDVPSSAEWYLEKRKEGIDLGLFCKKHDKDVVKNYIKWICRQCRQ